jgi:hypothetical protein
MEEKDFDTDTITPLDSKYQFTVKFKSLEFLSISTIPEAVSVAFYTPS